MDKDGCVVVSLIVGVVIGLVIMAFSMTYGEDGIRKNQEAKEALGAAICDMEYNLSYDKYEDGQLFCQEEPTEHYDGVKVVIQGG